MKGKLYNPVLLRLYSELLDSIFNWNIAGTEIFYLIKDANKNRIEGVRPGFLTRVDQDGLCYLLALYSYDKYMTIKYSEDYGYGEEQDKEQILFYIEEIIELFNFHEVSDSNITPLKSILEKTNALYENDEGEYFEFIEENYFEIMDLIESLRNSSKKHFEILKSPYCIRTAERIFHDRELCEYLCSMVLTIFFDEPYEKWCDRPSYWPTWLRPALLTRDSFRCAFCDVDISKPDAEVHIDHIIPLKVGGFNDPINLQLLCSDCNLKKGSNNMGVYSSIPKYFSKARKYSLPALRLPMLPSRKYAA